jgi:preprotein translocase subunit SecD
MNLELFQQLVDEIVEKLPKDAQKDAIERVREIVANRVDEFGVKETSITRQGENHIVVQLPGVTDRKISNQTRPSAIKIVQT